MRSRTVLSLAREAKHLIQQGVREFNLISQDSTAYGRDLRDGTGLGNLMKELGEIDGVEWSRLHYVYLHGLRQGLLEQFAKNPRVCSYLDIPFHHS